MPKALTFAKQLVDWQRLQGRHDLPWQRSLDPYRVWLSEIMLQQTQVVTVLGYYETFLKAFPTVRDLAMADVDDVLALWSGLGYYRRARHLHECARQVLTQRGGEFPKNAAKLQTLKGIGPSTAAAVASLCFKERVAIFDGNVKRVLSRYLAFEEDLALATHAKALQAHAQALLPTQPNDMPTYTQAIMDLGATVCTPSKPNCPSCPVKTDCGALTQGRQADYPKQSKRVKRSSETWWVLCATTPQGDVWLQQRPPTGVWTGLYTQPMFESEAQLLSALPMEWHGWVRHLPTRLHVLTHKDLHLHACAIECPTTLSLGSGAWYSPAQWKTLGMPTPARKWLDGTWG